MKPLYVVTCVFNPRRWRSRIRLYQEYAEWVKRYGVQLLTVEIAFGERPFAVTEPGNPWHLQLRTRNEIWHKERALNLGLARLSQLVPDWGYVSWMDADIKLVRDDWATEAVHLLQHYAIIQMFGEAHWLDPHYHQVFLTRSIGRNYEDHGKIDWGYNPGLPTKKYAVNGHPGLAWAFRRDELKNIGGWLDICVGGSGDVHMTACYANQWEQGLSPKASPGYRRAIERYGALCTRYVRGNWSYMPGVCNHYWHGKVRQRGYETRWIYIDKYQFDPYTDLLVDEQGLYKWNLDDPRVMALAIETRKVLAARNEDSCEV